jgi:hypothetical protein
MIPPILYIKNFYDDDVKKELNNWTLFNYQNDQIFTDCNNNPPGTAFTTRWTETKIDFPKSAYRLQEKIIQHLNLSDYKLRYDAGIINSVCYPGCIIFEHTDSATIDDHIIYHCNIVTKKPKGGVTCINGQMYDIDENDLLCYAVSELSHSVSLVEDSLRIMWIFGFHLPRGQLQA